MAFSFYQRRLLSMGNARKLAGLDKWAFIEGLAERGIDRHYFEQELQEDLRVIGKSG
jgi:predicted HTH domain antitoxin